MAGQPGKVATLTAEVERLTAELNGRKAEERAARTFTPREFHQGTKAALIRDLLTMADDAATIDEVAAAWNVEAEDVQRWGEDDVEFATALRRARTRARAAASRMVRNALNSGRSLPGSVIDKLMALYPKGDAGAEDDASALIVVDAR